MSSAGFIARPSLDGIQLSGIDPKDFDVTPIPTREDVRLATGGLRRTIQYNGAKLPDLKLIHEWKTNYERLAKIENLVYLRRITLLLSRPGLHTWTDWKHERVSWTSDGVSSEFLLPWFLAPYTISLPAENPLGDKLVPWVSSDISSVSGLTVVEKMTSAYDAGNAGSGEVWIDTEGKRLKIEAALSAGSVLYGEFVPIYNVYISSDEVRRIQAGREGRVILIQEKI